MAFQNYKSLKKPIYGVGLNSQNKKNNAFPLPTQKQDNFIKTKNKELAIYSSRVYAIQIPQTHHEALRDKNWKNVMNEEIKPLNKNQTWEIVDLPKGKKIVGCKWVFVVKYNVDGSLERYKSRLVAKGYTQTYRVDYQETFAPMAKMNTVRVLLSLETNFDWYL